MRKKDLNPVIVKPSKAIVLWHLIHETAKEPLSAPISSFAYQWFWDV
ncbi:hypothetical protein EV13_2407 [Prochlorococcus sp. MIT 0702]|nr:hypothetical protein EV13_2407 [Prochlorococcus sp. MIT 0702]